MKILLLFGALALSINVFAQSTVKIGNLEVMTEDLGAQNWENAKKACKNLGDGWRLPSKNELNLLNENKEKIGGFAEHWYWSSTDFKKKKYTAWVQYFGDDLRTQMYNYKYSTCYVRAVRTF